MVSSYEIIKFVSPNLSEEINAKIENNVPNCAWIHANGMSYILNGVTYKWLVLCII